MVKVDPDDYSRTLTEMIKGEHKEIFGDQPMSLTDIRWYREHLDQIEALEGEKLKQRPGEMFWARDYLQEREDWHRGIFREPTAPELRLLIEWDMVTSLHASKIRIKRWFMKRHESAQVNLSRKSDYHPKRYRSPITPKEALTIIRRGGAVTAHNRLYLGCIHEPTDLYHKRGLFPQGMASCSKLTLDDLSLHDAWYECDLLDIAGLVGFIPKRDNLPLYEFLYVKGVHDRTLQYQRCLELARQEVLCGGFSQLSHINAHQWQLVRYHYSHFLAGQIGL